MEKKRKNKDATLETMTKQSLVKKISNGYTLGVVEGKLSLYDNKKSPVVTGNIGCRKAEFAKENNMSLSELDELLSKGYKIKFVQSKILYHPDNVTEVTGNLTHSQKDFCAVNNLSKQAVSQKLMIGGKIMNVDGVNRFCNSRYVYPIPNKHTENEIRELIKEYGSNEN